MSSDAKTTARKDTFEGAELSTQVKRAMEEKKKNAKEFECIDGDDGRFSFSAVTVVVE
jgi:hypothetical protein